MRELALEEGLFNFHLRSMRKLIDTTKDGKYVLSNIGRIAYDIIVRAQVGLATGDALFPKPALTPNLLAKRVTAFLVDGLIFFVFSGVWLDPFLWSALLQLTTHISELKVLHPWLFHPEHIPEIGELIFRVVGSYSHIFFAVFITLTLLDAYKGQTPGRYLLGIRVVTVANRRLDLVEAGIRNIGKVFLLPLDLIIGLLFFYKRGYIRFFDYYTKSKVEKVRGEV
ncbi:MAG: RDD family protein [Nitrososphaerota archaeon]